MSKTPTKAAPPKESQQQFELLPNLPPVEPTIPQCGNCKHYMEAGGICQIKLPPMVKTVEDWRSHRVLRTSLCSFHTSK